MKDLISAQELNYLAQQSKEMQIQDQVAEGLVAQIKAQLQPAQLEAFVTGATEKLFDHLILESVAIIDAERWYETYKQTMCDQVTLTLTTEPGRQWFGLMNKENEASCLTSLETVVQELAHAQLAWFNKEATLTLTQSQTQSIEAGWATDAFDWSQLYEIRTYTCHLKNGQTTTFWQLLDTDTMDFYYGKDARRQAQPHKGGGAEMVINATTDEVYRPSYQNFASTPRAAGHFSLDTLNEIPLEVSVVLGSTRRQIKDVLTLNVGSVLALNQLADAPVEIYINQTLIATGEVVVVNDNFGVKIKTLI